MGQTLLQLAAESPKHAHKQLLKGAGSLGRKRHQQSEQAVALSRSSGNVQAGLRDRCIEIILQSVRLPAFARHRCKGCSFRAALMV